ncbi:BPSL0067 family protein [Herbaspirillum sp. ST 5-3]|uniref:BPSL0067 family protein n=1 Tax=Oxalobacteraceae TaxID=75682 RepID=UPI0010A3A53D|nr:BPSL0067 family protein [Herbaspirillum sp. ST 5-3]
MPHFSIYQGDIDSLLAKDAPQSYMDGECAKLPQALTDVGWTGKWKPGPRVVDLAYLNPGTVIANFKLVNGVLKYPNEHFFHAGLFYEFGEKNMSGGYVRIWMIDQWRGKSVDKRYKLAYAPEEAKRKGVHPCDNANEFYVVVT